MIVQRRFPLGLLAMFAARSLLIAGLWSGAVLAAHLLLELDFLRVPFLPFATIGTAVAFYMGFMSMESIGDASEDPLERSMNDVPVNALSRTIEIDLREMLGESEQPAKEAPAGFVLY